ncbi:hypothetical protein [Dehalogenimonas alkenigignens]|uniref:Uncharacterized protein n=1 Tax=Dehalogenimonas alkenigignens TaxID=1217799 RepID=A0A0W0GLA2_9CHLR|nr:hypothetical protein [Dehalogenimonas alkenigignens]KTB49344.1 hypothetical protein DEALK_02570 [Dehalogenimonas alkenigignens]PVV83784.1 hypothetical protein DD509_06050 [Dehalogenimonas alkenigignens]
MLDIFKLFKRGGIAQPETGQDVAFEAVRITDTEKRFENTVIRLVLSPSFRKELFTFLEQKGYLAYGQENKGIAQLIRYGLSGKNRAKLEKNREDLDLSKYAGMRFQLSQWYHDLNAMTLGLSASLEENRKLKQLLRDRGMSGIITEDEWDKWDREFIDMLFKRYVFGDDHPTEPSSTLTNS